MSRLPAATLPLLAVTLWLSGCATTVPLAIRTPPPEAVTVPEVQQDPSRFEGQLVRWGGSILKVVNGKQSTDIEVLARPLDTDGEPRIGAPIEGRFIAQLPGFVDPSQYPKDRLLTVVGTVKGIEKRQVGKYPYKYPVVSTQAQYLWPAPRPQPYPYFYGYVYGYPYPWPGPWLSPWNPPPWGPPWPGYWY